MPPTTKPSEHVAEQSGAYVGRLAPAPASYAAVADPAAAPTEAMTPSLVGVAAGDRCTNCGSPLAADQHYCLQCGERRGQARFSATPAAGAVSATNAREPLSAAARFSSGTALIAGVATLLLAMGIGVLIGRSGGNSGQPANSKVQVVTVGGAGASSAGTAGASNSSGSANASNSTHHRAGSKSGAKANSTSAVKTVKSLPPPTVTIGAKGQGAGYQHGHFTGNFFGGG